MKNSLPVFIFFFVIILLVLFLALRCPSHISHEEEKEIQQPTRRSTDFFYPKTKLDEHRRKYIRIKVASEGDQKTTVYDMNDNNKKLVEGWKHAHCGIASVCAYGYTLIASTDLGLTVNVDLTDMRKANAMVLLNVPGRVWVDFKNHKDTQDNMYMLGPYVNECGDGKIGCGSFVSDKDSGSKFVEVKFIKEDPEPEGFVEGSGDVSIRSDTHVNPVVKNDNLGREYIHIKVISDGDQKTRVCDRNNGDNELFKGSKHSYCGIMSVCSDIYDLVPDKFLDLTIRKNTSSIRKANSMVLVDVPSGIWVEYKNHKDPGVNFKRLGPYKMEPCDEEGKNCGPFLSDQDGGQKFIEVKFTRDTVLRRSKSTQ